MSKIILKVTHLETQQSKEFTLPLKIQQKIFIGRSEQCEVPLLDPKLSRKHFSLLWDGKDLWAGDEKSTNGSLFLGNTLGEKQKINSGDKIEAGSHIFELVQAPNFIETPSEESFLPPPSPAPSPSPTSGLRKEKALPTLSPHLFENSSSKSSTETSPNGLHQLDGAKPVEAVLSIFKRAIKKPAKFFEDVEFSGKVSVSLLYILGSVIFSNLFKGIIPQPVNVIIFAPIQLFTTLFYCGILHLLRNFLQTKGSFSNFLRFSAYATILQIPFNILAVGPFGIFTIVVSIYLIWVWLQVFKPNIGRWILMLVFAGFLFFGILVASILAIYSVAKNTDSTQQSAITQKIMEILKPYMPPSGEVTPPEGAEGTEPPANEDGIPDPPTENLDKTLEKLEEGMPPPPPPSEEEAAPSAEADNEKLAPPSAGEEPALPSTETDSSPSSP